MKSVLNTKVSRRNFCRSGALLGTGAFAGGSGLLLKTSSASAAQHVLGFGSPYATDAEFAPSAQGAFKRNVEKVTGGEIQVDIFDNGKRGAGGKLLGGVARNSLQGGIISISNLSRYTSAVDVLNIPFWSATNQNFLNLVKSSAWNDAVNKKVSDKGLHILYPCVVGARTAATVKAYDKLIRVPEDMQGVKFRIPSSEILKQFYDLTGAKPTKVKWSLTAGVARAGRIQALDPSPLGLYSGPDNLKDAIAKISLIDSVHDGWVAILSMDWLKTLPAQLRDKLLEAAELTFQDQLNEARNGNKKVRSAFEALGTEFYEPTADEKKAWQAASGQQRSEWTDWKTKLVGSVADFDRLVEAANTSQGVTF